MPVNPQHAHPPGPENGPRPSPHVEALVPKSRAKMLCPSWAAWTIVDDAMFIQDFVRAERSFDEVRALVLADPRALLIGNARDAYRDGERLFLRLEASTDHAAFGKKVQVELADPYECQDSLVVPMHWWALGATRLFPHLDAVLEFASLGSTWT